MVPVAPAPCWDHPRVGGEKVTRLPTFRRKTGSPPRGRGKANAFDITSPILGITPAWAGKRKPPPGDKSGGGDHPRVGGEKLQHLVEAAANEGITPAWAGKSPPAGGLLSGPQDHPRVGGEKCCSTFWIFSAKGSPPRGRGKVEYTGSGQSGIRITPAWAGKSSSRSPYCNGG